MLALDSSIFSNRHRRHSLSDTPQSLSLQSNGTSALVLSDSLRGSSVKIGTIQRRLAWPLRKDGMLSVRETPRPSRTHENV